MHKTAAVAAVGLLLLLLQLFVKEVNSGNILVAMPLSSRSHKHIFNPIVNELARRGHSVTIISPYAEKHKVQGVTEMVEPELARLDVVFENLYLPNDDGTRPSTWTAMFGFNSLIREVCTKFLTSASIKNIVDGEQEFDLLILDMILAECGLGLAYKLQIPFAHISPNSALTTNNHNLRNPLPNSFCPSVMLAMTDKMTFYERLITAISDVLNTVLRHYIHIPIIDEVSRNHLGDNIPSSLEIEKNVSLIILNGHPTVSHPKPLMPHIIEAGGMHCVPPKPLPQDLEEWINGAKDPGFIYMSFGSIFKDSGLPNKYKKIFLESFSKIPQRVFWKIKGGENMDLPSNVRISDWAPQQDLLGHPSIRAFISHGGLLSLQESTYHAVPILGIPAAIDQMHNIAKVNKDGTGLLLNWEDITLESFSRTLNRILTDSSFKENMLKRSKAMKDRPQTPLETTAFWIEHVLRHKGTPHLRSAALDLEYYEFYQLDVLAFLVVLLILWMLVSYWLIKLALRRCWSSKKLKITTPASSKIRKLKKSKRA